MKSLALLPREEILVSSNNGSLLLTNHRLRQTIGPKTNQQLSSILLRNISSIVMNYKENTLFLIVAVVSFIAAIVG
ncbi:MAG: hypothetical protein JKY48_16670, partial [Flavobacteriales bacterium]|nr:hypothetical protein [Flavobacteriales bacterium]